jgi:hypothetical protein
MPRRLEKRTGVVHRPYHVTKDLGYAGLLKRDDFEQYKNLRNDIIEKLFKYCRAELTKGGNKAKLLARRLG